MSEELRFLRQVQDASNSNVKEPEIDNVKSAKKEELPCDKSIQPLNVVEVDSSAPVQVKDLGKEITSPLKEKTPALKLEAVVKTLDIGAKSPETSEILCDNKPVILSPPIQNSECINVDKVPDATISDEISSFSVDNLASKEKEKSESDSSVKDIAEISCALPQPLPDQNISPISDDEKVIDMLLQEEKMLQIQSEELMLLGDELRRKVFSEKMEIERLKTEIHEYQQLYKYKRYSFDSTENSSSESEDSSDSDEEEQMSSVLEDLIRDNTLLEAKNMELSKVIQQERERCLSIKVQLKMLQQTEVRSDANYRTRM